MTQLETLEMMRDALLINGSDLKIGKGGFRLGSYYYERCLHNINNMIKSRRKTPEQLERENERRRAARAKKRVERDEKIWKAISPYLCQPHTASELETIINRDFYEGKIDETFTAGEIISFFNRHCNEIPSLSCTPPRRERTFQIRD